MCLGICLMILATATIFPLTTKAVVGMPLTFYWARTFGGTGADAATSTQSTSDGGFIVGGTSNANIWLVKLDSKGNVEWQKTYGWGGVFSLRQTADGGYVVAAGPILRLDASGNIVWEKTYSGYSALSVEQTSDGGFITAGDTRTLTSGSGMLLRTNSSGDVIWQKTFLMNNGFPPSFWSVRQLSDGGFVAAGQTKSFGNGDIDAWVLRLDAAGNLMWDKSYGGLDSDLAFSIDMTSDGGFVVAGQSRSFSGGFMDAWVFKIDPAGSVVWQKAYGGRGPGAFSVALSVQSTPDSGFVVAGYTSGFGAGLNDAWVFKLDSLGNPIWQRTFGGAGYDLAQSVAQASNGGFIVAGYMEVQPVISHNSGALVLRLAPDGNIPHCHIMGQSTPVATDTNATVTILSGAGLNATSTATITNATATNISVQSNLQCISPAI